MNKTVLLATLMLAPAAFVFAQDVKVNATGSVDSGVVNVQVTTEADATKASWNLKENVKRTTGDVEVNVDMAVPTVDMAGVVNVMVDATSTPTTTAEMVVDAEVQAVKDKWIEVLSSVEANAGINWEPTDYSVSPDTMMEGDTVEVKSTQEVSLFGFIKIEMDFTAQADMEGNVTNIQKPWFAMFAW